MPTVRDLKKRIRAVENTRQITKAMEMVAAAKLRRAQQRIESYKPYANKMVEMLGHLSAASSDVSHPFFEKREVSKTALVLFTSDRGFCGSYNANLIRKAHEYIRENNMNPENFEIICVGKKGHTHFKLTEFPIANVWMDFSGNMDLAKVKDMTYFLTRRFLDGEIDRVILIYADFISTARYDILSQQFLPIQKDTIAEGEPEEGEKEYIFEPDAETIYEQLLPSYTQTLLQMVMASALAAEHGTRMVAMGAATKNAGEMIDSLTLSMNKARQAMITNELLEIVSGAEALES